MYVGLLHRHAYMSAVTLTVRIAVVLNRPATAPADRVAHSKKTAEESMRKKGTKVAALFPERRRAPDSLASPVAPPAAAAPATIGWIVAAATDEKRGPSVMVDFPSSPHGPAAARLATSVTADDLKAAIATRQPAVLVFENGDLLLPILVGLVRAPVTAPDATVLEADVDGKRVRVVGKDEIVLQCGQASITLRRNGRIVVRGTYVETHSEGTNRIKGGQVQIN